MKFFYRLCSFAALAAVIVGCCNCRSLRKNQKPLVGTEWQLVQLGGVTYTPETERFTLLFGEENHLSGIGACNRISGSYTAGEKNALSIGPLAATRMACPGMEREMEFFEAVESTTRYDMDGEMLLLLDGDTLKAVFQAAPQAE